ncbi:Clp protease ClpP [Clostridium botulinum]|uniref:head maturation protease, ClpP-related n=1 Tax=Clostridium botulinum TaxID=1491 RepID=UPI0007730D98|nr:head maturation protease, ClpP-related [Clostridium botulinum]NFL86233.1 Clp protease ClpP [Clostridium botulinum]NFO19692.1 Clp protease ClpP [Clostridium botulinum]
MPKKFFEVKNQTEDKAEIYIIGQIQTEKPWYEDGEENKDNYLRDFIKTIQDLKDVKNLELHINSPGGALFAGVTMYNLLKNHLGHKKVYVDGSAASAASVIAMAGDEIIIPKNAFLMIHKPMVGVQGNANDLQKAIQMLDTIEVGMLSIYEDNLTNEDDKGNIKQMVQDETWLDGEKAAKYFKNVKVVDEVNIEACSEFDFSCYTHTPKELLNRIPKEPLKPKEPKNNNENEIKLWKVKLDLLRV